MSTATLHIPPYAANGDGAILSHIAALRDSIRTQRKRAMELWEGCAQGGDEAVQETRATLGRYTEHLLKAMAEEACG